MKRILIETGIVFGIVVVLVVVLFRFLPLYPLQILESLQPVSTSLPVQPKINLTFAKGMWLTSLTVSPHGHSIADPSRLKQMGVNLVAFPVMILPGQRLSFWINIIKKNTEKWRKRSLPRPRKDYTKMVADEELSNQLLQDLRTLQSFRSLQRHSGKRGTSASRIVVRFWSRSNTHRLIRMTA